MASNLILCLVMVVLIALIVWRLSYEKERLDWLSEWRRKWANA